MSERAKIIWTYIGFQTVMLFLGPLPAILAPVFFLYIYLKAKQECR